MTTPAIALAGWLAAALAAWLAARARRSRSTMMEAVARVSHELRGPVGGGFAPRQIPSARHRQRHYRIQVSPRYRTQNQDQNHQDRPGGERIRQQGNRDIAHGQPLSHDAGSYNPCQ